MSKDRESTRFVLSARVDLRPLGAASSVPRYSANLSKTGMFVVSSPLSPRGTMLQFALQLSSEDRVCGLAEVMWLRSETTGPEGRPAGMGVCFRYLEGDGLAMLERYLDTYHQSLGSEYRDEDTGEIPRWMLPVGIGSGAETLPPRARPRATASRSCSSPAFEAEADPR